MKKMPEQDPTAGRRNFLKKTAYLAPAIMTLKVAPSFAAAGSGYTTTNNTTTSTTTLSE